MHFRAKVKHILWIHIINKFDFSFCKLCFSVNSPKNSYPEGTFIADYWCNEKNYQYTYKYVNDDQMNFSKEMAKGIPRLVEFHQYIYIVYTRSNTRIFNLFSHISKQF